MNTSAPSSASLSAPPTTPLAPAIECSHVHQVFRTRKETVHAVNDVSLRIDRGEIVALLGPNGAGKTTLLDMILGMSEPKEGTVSVFGHSAREAVSKGFLGAVQQTGGLLDDISVRETVVMIASLYDQHMPVNEALERAGATSFAKRKVSKCSGGQQQRLRFALALLPEPDLLVLDEPTAGMDVQARHEFWDTMHAEAREGRTVLFATHYLQEAQDFAQRVVLLDHGSVHHDGTVDSFRAASRSQTVTFSWPSTTPLPDIPGVARLDRRGERITARTQDADQLARLLLTETPASELEISRGGLEEAFTALINRAVDS